MEESKELQELELLRNLIDTCLSVLKYVRDGLTTELEREDTFLEKLCKAILIHAVDPETHHILAEYGWNGTRFARPFRPADLARTLIRQEKNVIRASKVVLDKSATDSTRFVTWRCSGESGSFVTAVEKLENAMQVVMEQHADFEDAITFFIRFASDDNTISCIPVEGKRDKIEEERETVQTIGKDDICIGKIQAKKESCMYCRLAKENNAVCRMHGKRTFDVGRTEFSNRIGKCTLCGTTDLHVIPYSMNYSKEAGYIPFRLCVIRGLAPNLNESFYCPLCLSQRYGIATEMYKAICDYFWIRDKPRLQGDELYFAAMNGDMERTVYLLRLGHNPRYMHDLPMRWATIGNHVDVAILLFLHGSPFFEAACDHHAGRNICVHRLSDYSAEFICRLALLHLVTLSSLSVSYSKTVRGHVFKMTEAYAQMHGFSVAMAEAAYVRRTHEFLQSRIDESPPALPGIQYATCPSPTQLAHPRIKIQKLATRNAEGLTETTEIIQLDFDVADNSIWDNLTSYVLQYIPDNNVLYRIVVHIADVKMLTFAMDACSKLLNESNLKEVTLMWDKVFFKIVQHEPIMLERPNSIKDELEEEETGSIKDSKGLDDVERETAKPPIPNSRIIRIAQVPIDSMYLPHRLAEIVQLVFEVPDDCTLEELQNHIYTATHGHGPTERTRIYSIILHVSSIRTATTAMEVCEKLLTHQALKLNLFTVALVDTEYKWHHFMWGGILLWHSRSCSPSIFLSCANVTTL